MRERAVDQGTAVAAHDGTVGPGGRAHRKGGNVMGNVYACGQPEGVSVALAIGRWLGLAGSPLALPSTLRDRSARCVRVCLHAEGVSAPLVALAGLEFEI
jgi:hypothetical protein